MIPKKIIRKKVLEALKMASGYGKAESMVRELVTELTGEDPGLQDLRDVMDGLHCEAAIRSEKDEDNIVLWYITAKGTAKLNTL
jgi:hypothetical protein